MPPRPCSWWPIRSPSLPSGSRPGSRRVTRSAGDRGDGVGRSGGRAGTGWPWAGGSGRPEPWPPWLGPGITVETVVSQGCRPFGAAPGGDQVRGQRHLRTGGDARSRAVGGPGPRSLTEAESGPGSRWAGCRSAGCIDEHRETFGRGDFLLRSVLGADRRNGALAVGDVMPVGTTVQFHLRDARTADEDLQVLLKDAGPKALSSSPATAGDRGCSRNRIMTPG